jgi:hypothetical protein
LSSASGFASLLYGGQEQGDEDRDDGDHHEQFDECEGAATHEFGPFPKTEESIADCRRSGNDGRRLLPAGRKMTGTPDESRWEMNTI